MVLKRMIASRRPVTIEILKSEVVWSGMESSLGSKGNREQRPVGGNGAFLVMQERITSSPKISSLHVHAAQRDCLSWL